MMKNTIIGLEFYNIFYNFFIYSFFGWIYESVYVSFRKKTWINRGFLNGPVIPIYGVGATLFYIVFFNIYTIHLTNSITVLHMISLYFIGMISATLLEYITSWAMEKLFHAKWWDYSDARFHIKGRISLIPSLFWGFLSIVMAYAIQPQVTKLMNWIPRNVGYILGTIFLVLFLGDFVITVTITLQLSQKLQAMEKLREELYEYANGIKWYEMREELKGRMRKYHVYEYIEEFRASIEKSYEHFLEKQKQLSKQVIEKKQLFSEVENKIRDFSSSYKKQASNKLQRKIYKRMFKAFPNMKVKNYEGVFADLKEKIKGKKNR